MTSEIRRLLDEVSEQIGLRTRAADFESVAKLAKLAATLQTLLQDVGRMENSLERIEQEVSTFRTNVVEPVPTVSVSPSASETFSASDLTDGAPIKVVVRWSGELEEKISQPTAAATVRAVLERALMHVPNDRFEKLSALKTGRGPLISRNPQVDYVNKVSGASYTYHRLSKTPWFVITHSSTQEKVDHLRAALGVLGLDGATVNGSPAIAPLTNLLAGSESDDGRI